MSASASAFTEGFVVDEDDEPPVEPEPDSSFLSDLSIVTDVVASEPSSDTVRGEDGYKVFSIRVKDSTVSELDAISEKTNRSRNELINMMLDFAIKNCEITNG